MTDILIKARRHLASLPPHLKDRYSAGLIEQLADEISVLREDVCKKRKLIEDYARICQHSSNEINHLRSQFKEHPDARTDSCEPECDSQQCEARHE
jgi:hypothetical protein